MTYSTAIIFLALSFEKAIGIRQGPHRLMDSYVNVSDTNFHSSPENNSTEKVRQQLN